MSASAQSSAEGAPSSSVAHVGVGGVSTPSRTGSDDTTLPIVGTCWRGKYEILAVIGENVWRGRAVEGGHAVVLRAMRPVEPEMRAQVWAKVGGIDSPHLQHARDAQRAGEWRVEIADAVPGIPLMEWRKSRASVDAATVKTVVAQLAEGLGALHAFALVHLNICPESILVEELADGIRCRIAALDAVSSFDRSEPVPAAVDPFYAPPEELGLNLHVAGPGLCSWDWWSLGRVVQELVLGRHVVGQLANAETRPASPEVRARAEALLLEADPKAPRAGAVETMTGLDPQTGLLLRGLLTSAKEARWTGDNVDRWVRGLPVKDHYATPRTDTHFRWRGRPCTVPEIAAILQSSEHWAENSVQLFEQTTPGTLAHFLRWAPTQTAANEQLISALELADSLPLKLSTPSAQRETVTLVALLQLSGAKLVWRGRPFESSTIGAMMDELGDPDAVMVLRALTTRATALQIERIDATAGRLLTEVGRTVGDVESVFRRYSWVAANDLPGAARIFRLAVEAIATLRTAKDDVLKTYAGSDHPAMEKMLKAANPSRAELVIIAWAGKSPEGFKFYTHAEAARRRAEALRTRGAEVTSALTWSQLEKAEGFGVIVLGGWAWFVITWLIVGAAALALWPGPLGVAFTLAPVLAALALRILAAPRQASALREYVPDVKWTWRDGPARCRRELRTAGSGATRRALETELAAIEKELATLKDVKPTPVPLPKLPRFGGVRFFGAIGWVLLLACVGLGGWRAMRHPPSVKDIKAAWSRSTPPKPTLSAVAGALAEEKNADVKVSWPYRPEDSAVKVTVTSTQAATAAQLEYAKKHGRQLVAPYLPETIDTPIVMPVPGTGGVATVMIFDGKRGELFNEQVYLLEFTPIPRSWIEVAGRKGVYLDQ